MARPGMNWSMPCETSPGRATPHHSDVTNFSTYQWPRGNGNRSPRYGRIPGDSLTGHHGLANLYKALGPQGMLARVQRTAAQGRSIRMRSFVPSRGRFDFETSSAKWKECGAHFTKIGTDPSLSSMFRKRETRSYFAGNVINPTSWQKQHHRLVKSIWEMSCSSLTPKAEQLHL